MWFMAIFSLSAVLVVLTIIELAKSVHRAEEIMRAEMLHKLLIFPLQATRKLLPKELERYEYQKLMPQIILLYGTLEAKARMNQHLSLKCFYFFIGILLALFLLASAGANVFSGLLSPLGGVVFWYLADYQLVKQHRIQTIETAAAFPEFVTALALQSSAGLHVRQALERIALEKASDTSHLYREVKKTILDMNNGMSEIGAWSALAERCRVREVTSLCGILIQYARMGGSHLPRELAKLASDSWDYKKQTVRRRGEEASSKLMIPTSIMFIAVLIICVTPAFLAIGGIM